MEQTFGVSYPTIKARLNRIAGHLEYVETNPAPSSAEVETEVLNRLNNGRNYPGRSHTGSGGPQMIPSIAIVHIHNPYWHKLPDLGSALSSLDPDDSIVTTSAFDSARRLLWLSESVSGTRSLSSGEFCAPCRELTYESRPNRTTS